MAASIPSPPSAYVVRCSAYDIRRTRMAVNPDRTERHERRARGRTAGEPGRGLGAAPPAAARTASWAHAGADRGGGRLGRRVRGPLGCLHEPGGDGARRLDDV